ncbi:MAG: hypothetical protein RRZ24_07825 [Clostridia bacterium]
MKRICWMLVLLLVLAIPLTALADDNAETPSPSVDTPAPVLAATPPAQPTTPQPASTPTPTPTPKPATGLLQIDSGTLYPGMDKTYAQGYIPATSGGKATIILPLLGNTYNNTVTINADLGTTSGSPFIYGNYSQTVPKTGNVYLFTLEIPLSPNRTNGLYPVQLTTQYLNANGEQSEQQFTVYVTISDGRSGDPTPTPTEKPVSNYVPSADSPELFVENCVISPTEVGGDEVFTVKVTIKNIGNKTANAAKLIFGCEQTDIMPVDANNAILLGTMRSGKRIETEFQLKTDKDALAGNREFFITLNFSARTGGTYDITRKFIIRVNQPTRIAYDTVSLKKEITAGETVTLPANVHNTGRAVIRNVTVTLEGAGLFPVASVFLGDIEPGEGKTGEMKVFIGMLSMTEGYTESYGNTKGTYTITYQDDAGEIFAENMEVSTKILQPVISPSPTPDPALQQAQSQWWITALIGFAIIAIVVSGVVVSKFVREMRMR